MATITLSHAAPDIAVLTFDTPDKGANVLSRMVLDELDEHLSTLEKGNGVAGLVIRSGKAGTFIAGADLREFVHSLDVTKDQTIAMCTRGRKLFQRLARCPFVTVAAIDGICVGGGAELAIWCDRRVLSNNPKTQYGFPEVKLGLFPGWGGTARTPRIAGLSNATELITGGESIDARAAAAMGLADDVTLPDRLLDASIALIRAELASGKYLADRQRWSGPIEISDVELTFLGATVSGYIQQQTKGQYPAPLAALEVLLGAARMDVDSACEMEAAGMAELFGTPINAALLNVFFLSDRNKKDPGVATSGVVARPVKSVGVIGAGIMGRGIAAANVKRQIPVTLTDAVPDALAQAVKSVLEEVSYSKAANGPDARKAIELAPLVNASTSDAELATSDVVIEAVVENLQVKKEVYARLEPLLGDQAILASNTSTIPITKLAEGLARPERFCGIHFFNPVRKMPLVEVIRGQRTSDETIATAVAYAKSIGKSPIVVNDGPGFLVNRLLMPYMNEAVELILDGVPISHVERAAKEFGMPMGPITLYDVVGLDTAFYAGRVMYEAFPERTAVSPLLPSLVKAGRLGQKSGAGFFRYKDQQLKGEPDPALDELVRPMLREKRKLSADEITHRLFLPMLLEATRILQEHIVRDVRDVDLGLIYGIGFPPFKGGLLFWADTLGAKRLLEWLAPLEYLGERTKPTQMLREMARRGGKFYDAGQ